MNRVHVHINVPDLAEARRYYSALLGAVPTVEKDDYLKWKLSDPAINLSVVTDEAVTGLMHLGVDFDSADGLKDLENRMKEAGLDTAPETGAHCCYARSDKEWLADPASVTWEAFHSFGEGMQLHDSHADNCCGQAEQACCA